MLLVIDVSERLLLRLSQCWARPWWGCAWGWAPWIHLNDAVGMIRFAMGEERLEGAVHAVAPDTPTQERFARALAASFGRRVWLRVPGAPMRVLMGEMATLLLDGQNVVPRVALAAGYGFRYAGLEGALADLAG